MNNSAVYTWTKTVLILAMAIFFSRVFFLTVVMGVHYGDLARGNMVRKQRLEPIRGIISDRYGKPLAMNIDHQGKTIRYYPGGETVATIVGYMGKPGENDLKNCSWCTGEMLVGKSGLEKQYQQELMGYPGEVLVEETANGQSKKEISRTESTPGTNLKTNIDAELQKISFLALKNTLADVGKSGAVLIAKVNGEVLALASAPSYDPNLFVANGKRSDFGGDYKDVESMLADTEGKPLFNRVVSGEFAPGSVFKLVTALAALEEGKITQSTTIVDTGEIKIGEYRFGNWYLDKYGRTEGEMNVVKALSRSNDVFFYKIGEALGADLLVSWTKRLGLGQKTGIDLPGESAGFVPSPYWREKKLGEKWFLGNTYHFSIGQGDLMTTPVQINRMTAESVSGMWCDPVLFGNERCSEENISPKNIKTLIAGMEEACSPGGTAFPLFEYAGKVYCKTGTAQKGGEDTLPNSWISVVVPNEAGIKEWVVITVLIEEGGEGSAVAAPIAKELVDYLLQAGQGT